MAYNILIVDDSAVMRSIIGKTIRLSGIPISEIFQAENGLKAIEVLEENWIDIAFVDINMPVMDGETLINQIRENKDIANMPIVVVSTEASETRIASLMEKGAEFIHKPFAPEDLREKIFTLTGVNYGTSLETSGNFDF